MKDAASAGLCVRALGPFEVTLDGSAIPEAGWPRRKTKELLKVLLTAPSEPFTVDQLIDALLPGADPKRARSNIRARVSELRGVLESDLARGSDSQYVKRIGEGYSFDLRSDCWVDTVAFRQALAEALALADSCSWSKAIEAFESGLALYRGEFLAADRYAEWAENARLRLRERYLEGLTRQAVCYAELGRLRQAITCCQQVLDHEPYRESVIRQLMKYQDAAGHRAQALDTYNEGAQALREYLDVDPAPETRALFDRIHSQPDREMRLDPRRIAVLPFANYSPDPEDEYFADGVTEELIGCLAKVRDLRVIARTSVARFKGTKTPVSDIARALSVGSVLEGSVRKAGDRVRICAQLIHAETEEHLWSDEYEGDLEDAFAIQKTTARKVAHALEISLASGERRSLAPQTIEDVTAHTMYLKGRYFQSQRHPTATLKALNYLETAARLDPSHAMAFAALADAYAMSSENALPISEAYEKAREAAERALDLDDTLAEAHTAMGLIHFAFEGDAELAARCLKRAMTLNPSYTQAYVWQGFVAAELGQYHQAISSYNTAIALDPLSPYNFFLLARSLAKMNRFDEAFSSLDKALELNPTHLGSMTRRIWCNHLLHRWKEADSAIAEFGRVHGEKPQFPMHRGIHLLYLGQLAESRSYLQRACALDSPGSSFYHRDLLWLGQVALCSGRFDEALQGAMSVLRDIPSRVGVMDHVFPLFRLGEAYDVLGKHEDALAALTQASAILFAPKTGQTPWVPSGEQEMAIWIPAAIGMVHAAMGHEEDAQAALAGLRTCPVNRAGQSARAVLCFRRGLLEEGFEALNLAVENHDVFILLIKTHPWFDPVRDDPRFADILARMNLAG